MSKRRIMLLLLIFALIGAGGYYWWYFNHITVTEFQGMIVRTEPNILIVQGYDTAEDHPELQDENKKREVQVSITPETRIVKTVIHLPTVAQIEANGGFYKLEDQPRDTLSGSLEEIGANQVISIRTTSNIYHRTSFTAHIIEYVVPLYPQE